MQGELNLINVNILIIQLKYDIMEQLYTTTAAAKLIPINPAFAIDPFYRYKMTQVILSVIKGKTYLTNIDIVAKDLQINPEFIIKYLGICFGTRIGYNNKLDYNQRAWLSGIFDSNRVSPVIEEFIQGIILCKVCGNPELDYLYEDKVILSCRSCGASDSLKNRNLPDKFTKYITSNMMKRSQSQMQLIASK